jgi:hypothetical protein
VPGAELVPPSQSAVPLDWPALSSETKKLSTDVCVRAQLKKQSMKSVFAVFKSNKLEGTVVSAVQP